MNKITILILFGIFTVFSCNSPENNNNNGKNDSVLSGTVTVFHAGSLSIPFREMKKEFEKANPKVKILLESAGSVTCARKITDLKKDCDIMASADEKIIRKMLIPEYTDSCINFATNEMVLAYSEKSKFSNEINEKNWSEILQKKEVIFGRSEPDSDPCGYRTLLTWQLADKFYKKEIYKQLIEKNLEYIRPKEVDLVALLESNNIDYFFVYRSVAQQHKFKFVTFNDSINLKNSNLANLYKTVSVKINGKKPGEKMEIFGQPMVYGITFLKNAKNTKASSAFFKFIISKKGSEIMEKNGQPSLLIFQQ